MTTTLNIKGMHCASCKALIEDVCQEIPGVTSCIVDTATGRARIEHDETVSAEQVQHEIESLGEYTATLV
jgi:copper chaperone CopZ